MKEFVGNEQYLKHIMAGWILLQAVAGACIFRGFSPIEHKDHGFFLGMVATIFPPCGFLFSTAFFSAQSEPIVVFTGFALISVVGTYVTASWLDWDDTLNLRGQWMKALGGVVVFGLLSLIPMSIVLMAVLFRLN